MEIILDKDDILEILARHFDLEIIDFPNQIRKKIELKRDEIYWEGNPKPKES